MLKILVLLYTAAFGHAITHISDEVNCTVVKSAFSEHSDILANQVQPYMFHPATNLFDVLYYSFPGDELSHQSSLKKTNMEYGTW